MENTLSTITILKEKKNEIKNFCDKAKNEILAGNDNSLKILKHQPYRS